MVTLYNTVTSACVSIAAVGSSAGAASAAASSVCMGSSVELAAVLTPSVIEEIDCIEVKKDSHFHNIKKKVQFPIIKVRTQL